MATTGGGGQVIDRSRRTGFHHDGARQTGQVSKAPYSDQGDEHLSSVSKNLAAEPKIGEVPNRSTRLAFIAADAAKTADGSVRR